MGVGVSFSPGGASWAYGQYHALRHQLAQLEGIDLEAMCGYGGDVEWEGQSPLVPLFDSSDVHGFFSSSQCRQMVPRLRAILRFNADILSKLDWDRLNALTDGMELCADLGCAMEYG